MRFKRVLLVKPMIRKGENIFPYHPSVGLGYLAELLKANRITYDVLDMQLGYKFRDLKKKIDDFRPDLIGISMMTFRYKDNYSMLKKLKKFFPDVRIIVGGPYMSSFRKKAFEECSTIDFGATLEAEDVLIELCKGKELADIKGLLYRNKEEIIYTGDRAFRENIDTFPWPTYDGFELDKYVDNILAPKYLKDQPSYVKNKLMAISSSRGCPFNCIYCPAKLVIGKRFRARSAKNIADEIEYWYKRNYRQFAIIDDNFTLLKERVFEFCDEIEKRELTGLRLSAPSGLRADRVTRDMLKRMKDIGFWYVSYGVEAGNNRILKNLKKGETIERIEQAIKDSCDIGLDVGLFFLVGSPGETFEDVKDSVRLALKYPVDNRFYMIIPFPNTELFEWINKNNYFVKQPEEYLNDANCFHNDPLFETPEFTAKQRKQAYRYVLSIKKKVRKKTFKEEYGPMGWIWASVTIDLLPIMWRVYSFSPQLYRKSTKVYYFLRSFVRPKES